MAITELSVKNDALRLLGEPALATTTDDVESRYVLDSAWADSINFVLRQAPWRFALKTETLTGSGSGTISGYGQAYTKPASFLRLHALFVLSGRLECPVDFKDEATKWYSQVTSLTVRYISSNYNAPSDWTEQFSKALAAYLAFQCCDKITGDPARTQQIHAIFKEFLQAAIDTDALPENQWLPHQMNGTFLAASRAMLEKGFWRFALKTSTPSSSGSPIAGYSTAYPQPGDWMRTHSVFKLSGANECPLDIREQAGVWHSNEAIKVRYLSTAYLDSTLWPEEFTRVVAAYLGFEVDGDGNPVVEDKQGQRPAWPEYLAAALDDISVDPDPWLKPQLDGTFLSAAETILTKKAWKFALKTVTPSTSGSPIVGYSTSYGKPADLLKTHAIFKLSGARECPLDVRDQALLWHSNEAIKVRYISSDALDSTLWPEEFYRVVAAFLGIDMGDSGVVKGENGKDERPLLWPNYMESAAQSIAIDDSPWLPHQLDGSFLAAARTILEKEFWRFALKTVAPSTGGVALAGYSTSYAQPADFLRTQAIFKLVAAKEYPLDVREQGVNWSANEAFKLRYLSTAGLDSSLWPEEFTRIVAAYLGFSVDGNPTSDQKAPDWTVFLVAAAEDIAVKVDPWLEHQLSGTFLAAARATLERAFWNFALKTATPSSSGTAVAGFSTAYPQPADWMRTHSVFKLSGSRECPLDVREQAGAWSSNEAIKVRYLSSTYLDSSTWPEQFMRVVAAYLGFEVDDNGRPQVQDGQKSRAAWPEYLAAAATDIALPDSPWLVHQFDGTFLAASRAILEKAFWRFALKTATPSSSGTAVAGFTTAYPKPADWLRTHAIFKLSGSKECPVDVREQGTAWSANEAIKVRYLSSDYLDSSTWPEEFKRVTAAYLGFDVGGEGAASIQGSQGQSVPSWPAYLTAAAANAALPDNPWLSYQLDGSLLPAVNYLLEQAMWKFAIVTAPLTPNVATPSAGFTYAFDKPTAWIRTVEVYYQLGTGSPDNRLQIETRDEGNDLHANYTPIVLRYLSSTLGRDSTAWSDAFMDALLAYLNWKSAMNRPGTPGTVLSARQVAYERSFENARGKDDQRERPRVNQVGRLVASRGGGSGFYRREQGW